MILFNPNCGLNDIMMSTTATGATLQPPPYALSQPQLTGGVGGGIGGTTSPANSAFMAPVHTAANSVGGSGNRTPGKLLCQEFLCCPNQGTSVQKAQIEREIFWKLFKIALKQKTEFFVLLCPENLTSGNNFLFDKCYYFWRILQNWRNLVKILRVQLAGFIKKRMLNEWFPSLCESWAESSVQLIPFVLDFDQL